MEVKISNDSELFIKNQKKCRTSKKDDLSHMRAKLAEEMDFFQYPNGENGIEASKLSELVPELNGTSIKSYIVTKSRSGSSFLGDLLNSVPGSFYFFEPLIVSNFTGAPSVEYLKKIFHCDFVNKFGRDYINFNQGFENRFFETNKRLFYYCRRQPQFCKSAKALSKVCRLFPLHLVKTIRFPLKAVYNLLKDLR